MTQIFGGAFDPETVEVMKSALDGAWDSLLPEQQARLSRTLLAGRILAAAAQGERDPVKLRAHALISIAPSG